MQGGDLFDQTATFKKGDKRRYLFKLVGVSGNSRLALTDGQLLGKLMLEWSNYFGDTGRTEYRDIRL